MIEDESMLNNLTLTYFIYIYTCVGLDNKLLCDYSAKIHDHKSKSTANEVNINHNTKTYKKFLTIIKLYIKIAVKKFLTHITNF